MSDQISGHMPQNVANPTPPRAAGKPVSISLPGHRAPAVGFEAPFDMLDACHERVERMLRLLQRLREHLANHPLDPPARDAARDVLRYFDQAGPHHHADEELHVFPAVLAAGSPALQPVVERLLQDHQDMHHLWAQVRQVLLNVRDGEATSWAGLQPADQALMDAYDALYRRHLQDENELVYPAARGLVTADAQQAMGEEMTRRRQI